MKLGFIGLGRMGGNMVIRLVKHGHDVIVTGRNPERLQRVVDAGATAKADYAELVAALGDQPVLWLMIPADTVDTELAKLLKLMPSGSIIVDGGNSDYRQTTRRAELAAEHGITLLDAGTSGGILAAKAGYCIMVGGDEAAVKRLTPVFETLAQPQGWGHFGPSGAGHYVKMVHNAIEYGMMQAYAEGFRMLKDNPRYPDLDLAKAAHLWQHGSIIDSKLNELNAQILDQNPELEGISGIVAESGEARWALESARTHRIPMPAIQAAFDARLASQEGQVNFGTKLLAAERNAFGGHDINEAKRIA